MRPRKSNQHLPRCVYPRHGAYYLVKKGKWILLGHDLASALTEYARRFEDPKDQGIAALIDDTLDAIRKGLAKNTIDQYEIAGRKLKHMLKAFRPDQVKPKDMARVKRLLADTPNMANRCLSFARQVFNYALEREMIDSNPVVGIPRCPEAKRTRLISAEEFAAIYWKASPRLQCMMDLWRLTGQRVMDVVRIRLRDLLADGIAFQQQKTGARLIVQWTPELEAVVARAKALNGNVRSLTLFSARRGRNRGSAPAYGTVHDEWTAACRAAGVEDADLRDLRAMAATATKKQGKSAQKLLGHTTEAMTTRYLRDREVPVVDGPSFGQVLEVGQKGK